MYRRIFPSAPKPEPICINYSPVLLKESQPLTKENRDHMWNLLRISQW